MGHYYNKDIISALEFGKTNPNADIEDWFDYNSRNITEQEIDWYKNIQYSILTIGLNEKKFEIFLFRDTQQSYDMVQNFINKFTGIREYYELQHMPGEFYGTTHYLISFDKDLYDLEKWNKHPEVPEIEILYGENLILADDYYDIPKEFNHDCWEGREKEIMKTYPIQLWDPEAYIKGYLKTDAIEFRPINELFTVIPVEK